ARADDAAVECPAANVDLPKVTQDCEQLLLRRAHAVGETPPEFGLVEADAVAGPRLLRKIRRIHIDGIAAAIEDDELRIIAAAAILRVVEIELEVVSI